MNPIVTAPPAALPVTLAQVHAQLSIDTDDYDVRLTGLIAAATDMVETYTGRALITRSYTGFLNWWPADPRGFIRRWVQLEKPPLISVTDLITYDDSDVPTTFDPNQYYVDTTRTLGRLVLRRGDVWPVPLRVANGIQIDWTAGYGLTAAAIPPSIVLAIQIVVGALNEQRGDEGAAVPAALPNAAIALLPPPI